MMNQLYRLSSIRDLLTEGFSDEELRALCFDVPDFRPVYDQLAESTGKIGIVTKLLEYADRHGQIDTLLALAREHNPVRYDEHGPYYADDPTLALQRQVTSLAQRLAALTPPTALTREQQYQIQQHDR